MRVRKANRRVRIRWVSEPGTHRTYPWPVKRRVIAEKYDRYYDGPVDTEDDDGREEVRGWPYASGHDS